MKNSVAEVRAKRDQLLRNESISLRDGAGPRAGAGFAQGRASTSDPVDLTASALPRPTSFEPEKAGVVPVGGVRPSGPSRDALNAFHELVVRARVARILRERDANADRPAM